MQRSRGGARLRSWALDRGFRLAETLFHLSASLLAAVSHSQSQHQRSHLVASFRLGLLTVSL